ncbi:haloalkane dehalogenase family protein [Aspergillus piperis CBS 112811]|uniref:Haloalkane dehalogenase family protein n=1 Tax=Aspergillus piperis CBS 112811 TaxID=1448313 RepID=A0A8G1QQB3_9EURO|nr:haloalkane dehalogenase family protein [Aspergillus piperis CBS 112811]RAH52301.1 haloalkane dehalogenase family protein [Aspergillus piperis CBS 112811]
MSLLTLHVGSSLAQAVLTILMTSYGYAATFVMSFTVCRLILFGSLLPIYLGKLSGNIIHTGVRNIPSLLSSQGRNRLIREAEEYRGRCESLAIAQCQGTYRFSESNLYRVRPQGPGWMPDIPWADFTAEMAICGATVRFMHQKPTLDGPAGCRRPIICLHGNPSNCFIWRNILLHLLEQGHEVYALDWLGHGRSDKPTHPESVTLNCIFTRFCSCSRSTISAKQLSSRMTGEDTSLTPLVSLAVSVHGSLSLGASHCAQSRSCLRWPALASFS